MMPEDLTDAILFTESELDRLVNRMSELDDERKNEQRM